LPKLPLKSVITFNWRPLRRALFALLIGIAALWAMPRSARAQLYVSQLLGNSSVGEYDATTGAAINANFITGLNEPVGLAVASVPEPSTWSMIAVGGVALLGMMLRKNNTLCRTFFLKSIRRLVTLHRHQLRPLPGAHGLLRSAPSSVSCAWAMAMRLRLPAMPKQIY
jgi:uncharacterized membrane protein